MKKCYHTTMAFKLPQSHLFKQLVGAIVGMFAAGLFYVGYQTFSDVQLSNFMMKADVVTETPTVVEDAPKAQPTDTTIAKDEFARLQERAREVAKQFGLKQPVEPSVALPVEDRTQQRLAARKQMLAQFNATTQPTASHDVTAVTAHETPHAAAPSYQTPTPVTQTALANSGSGMAFVAVLALLVGIALHYRQTLQRKLVALAIRSDV